jgi:kinetochore protein Mis13/DSN1
MLRGLQDSSTSVAGLRAQAQQRLAAVQANLEFKVDNFAAGIHTLDQRVVTAGREADRVLALAAARLKDREDREKSTTGTKEVPIVEVLRSLGRILPEGGD